jgi:glycosyltransferase involved in cell wall biosynthesis
MSNKKNKKKNSDSKENNNINLPFVSICTPTFNRRPFIPAIIKCVDNQIYPKDKLEWIIIDDGTDPIEDLIKDHKLVKYFKYNEKMALGKKRNIMHEKSKGDIIVYMDDDDYYPPERISHSVEKLLSDKNVLCAGSSEIYIYFKHIEKMYQFGPYGKNHATAGTFAFKKDLLNITQYDDEACLAEEKKFLRDYTIPFIQLDPLKTILVFSHIHNTFDKRKLLENINPDTTKKSNKVVDDFIKESDLKNFFLSIDVKLKNYDPGKPNMKPDVISQMISLEKSRRLQHDKNIKLDIYFDGKNIKLSVMEITHLLNKLRYDNEMLTKELNLVKINYNRLLNHLSNNK